MKKNVRDKSKHKRKHADHYVVSGVSALPLEDCIRRLGKMDFQVDDKLQFYRCAEPLGIEVEGYLAPRDDGLTLVNADAWITHGFAINFTFVIVSTWLFFVILLVTLVEHWDLTKLLLGLSSFIGVFIVWVIARLSIYRASRREAKRTIDYLYRRFEL